MAAQEQPADGVLEGDNGDEDAAAQMAVVQQHGDCHRDLEGGQARSGGERPGSFGSVGGRVGRHQVSWANVLERRLLNTSMRVRSSASGSPSRAASMTFQSRGYTMPSTSDARRFGTVPMRMRTRSARSGAESWRGMGALLAAGSVSLGRMSAFI